jgi:hypothetical protein
MTAWVVLNCDTETWKKLHEKFSEVIKIPGINGSEMGNNGI